MGEFTKLLALVLAAVILWLVVERQEKDIALVLTLTVCCLLTAACVKYLQPVVGLIREYGNMGGLGEDMIALLMKAAGIGFLSEIAGSVCRDAGNSSMGSMVHFFGCAAMVYVSIPLFEKLMSLIQRILGAA